MILAMAAVVTVVAAAVVCRYELAAAGSSSWNVGPAGGSGSARYWDSWSSSTAEAAVWCGHFLLLQLTSYQLWQQTAVVEQHS